MNRRNRLWLPAAGLFLVFLLGLFAAGCGLLGVETKAAPSPGLFGTAQAQRRETQAALSTAAPVLGFETTERPPRFEDREDFILAWRALISGPQLSAVFETEESCTAEELKARLEEIKNAYYPAMWADFERACYFDQWEVQAQYQLDTDGLCLAPAYHLRLLPQEGLSEAEALFQRDAFEEGCREIVAGLYAEGRLDAEMDEREKALALYIYVAQNLHYDEEGNSRTGYEALVEKTASCQGYTALYNGLCKLAGLSMTGMTGTAEGTGHAWSRIFSGGSWQNIDCTWGDPVPDRPDFWDEAWFWRSDEWMKKAEPGRSFDLDSLP